ncbi:FAD-dependent monooxygenase [Bradyrhizobium sp. AZCC 1719]|uniref:FAD-dependent monooxygenase n=1 Tax=Bradyrhizobium sp. AZCC 1719 TaxID=3117028 RepID=UPI002FF395E7
MYDVVIIGARCAGSALALMLARDGLDVLAIDRTTFPSVDGGIVASSTGPHVRSAYNARRVVCEMVPMSALGPGSDIARVA